MDRHVGSGSNHERLSDGYAGVKRTFYENLTLLLTRNGIKASEIQDVVAGLSGADNDTQTERLQEILRGFGFQYVMVCNDGYLPLKAECNVGIAYNCGTGVCCASIDSKGKMIKIGGLDEWSRDAEGGIWLLQQIFSSVYDDAVLLLRETKMTRKIAGLFDSCDIQVGQMETWLPKFMSEDQLQRRIIACFFDAYEAGDHIAIRIGEQMAKRAADYIAAAYRLGAFEEEPICVVLAGSILLKAANVKYLETMKREVVRRIGKDVRWIPLAHTAAYGAIQWIEQRQKPMKQAGGSTPDFV